MIPAERKLVIDRLRLVAQQWYDGPRDDSTRYHSGICYAATHTDGGNRCAAWYDLLGEAFESLGMHACCPFWGDPHSTGGDWTVRPLFCLLMADALEQME